MILSIKTTKIEKIIIFILSFIVIFTLCFCILRKKINVSQKGYVNINISIVNTLKNPIYINELEYNAVARNKSNIIYFLSTPGFINLQEFVISELRQVFDFDFKVNSQSTRSVQRKIKIVENESAETLPVGINDEDVFIIYYTDVPKKIETYEEYKSYTENEAHLLKGYFIDGEVRFITKCQQIRKLDIF